MLRRSPAAKRKMAEHGGGWKPIAGSSSVGGGGENQCLVREQDRFMPIANVIRIMRKVLPAHAKISDDAKETIQECVSEYISFITSEANERCQREQRKTITAEDVLWAMTKLGFDDYIAPLGVYLRRYRELEGDHRGSIRGESLQFNRAPMAAGGGGAMQPGNLHFAVAAGVYGLPPPPQVSSYIPTMHGQHHHLGGYGGDEGVVGEYYLGGVHGETAADCSPASAVNYDPYYATYRCVKTEEH